MGILGQKELTLNNGEYIRVSGIVRPEDISAGNTVPSNRLADAQTGYTGVAQLQIYPLSGWLSYRWTISPFKGRQRITRTMKPVSIFLAKLTAVMLMLLSTHIAQADRLKYLPLSLVRAKPAGWHGSSS